MAALLDLAARCEAALGASKALDREIALAVGWVRRSPSEGHRRHPAWFHPDDCRAGKVVMDSLHGTDVWRDPLAYTASLDAALALVPEGCSATIWTDGPRGFTRGPAARLWRYHTDNDAAGGYSVEGCSPHEIVAATPALALCAAALRARVRP